jgi:hypothetical protein
MIYALTFSLRYPAKQSDAIVMSLFPSNVRARLYNGDQDGKANEERPQTTKTKLKNFLNKGEEAHAQKIEQSTVGGGSLILRSPPIADLFPETTVLFADIATFTAWSSVRDPTQVFTLLESIYGAFDIIANKRGVFKVETIGDSYVAVTGLPEPRKDHAEVMIKFAADCRDKFSEVTRELEVHLGPDTGEVSLRHSRYATFWDFFIHLLRRNARMVTALYEIWYAQWSNNSWRASRSEIAVSVVRRYRKHCIPDGEHWSEQSYPCVSGYREHTNQGQKGSLVKV